MDWINDIEYYVLSTKHQSTTLHSKFLEGYRCWKSAWDKFRSEISISERLHSDGILTADEIGILFYKDECVGISCFTFGSLDDPSFIDISTLKGWDEISLQKLKMVSSEVMIGSQLSVSPRFTGKDQIVRWKEIIFLYTFMRFYHSNAGVMCAQLNLTRKAQDACGESFGATVIQPNIPFNYGGVPLASQLVSYEKKNFELIQETRELTILCQELWSKVIHSSEIPVINTSTIKKTA